MKKYYKIFLFIFVAFFVNLFTFSEVVYAKADNDPEMTVGEILSAGTDDEKIYAIVADPYEDKDIEVSAQIGRKEVKKVHIERLNEENVTIHTIILFDNSLSIPAKYRDSISDAAKKIIEARMPNEKITVSSFSDTVNYIVKEGADTEALKEAVDNLQYINQETYLTDVLYDLLSEKARDDRADFTRIIIFSDGVDNKAIGYTKEELERKVEENSCPVYSVGCRNGKNDEQLKNMFALSRKTKAAGFLLEENSNADEIVKEILRTNTAIKVTITPQDEDCDGSEKAVKLTIRIGNTEKTKSLEMKMPFGKESVSQAETVQVYEQNTEKALADNYAAQETTAEVSKQMEGNKESEEKEQQTGKTTRTTVAFLILIGVLAVAVILLLVHIVLKKKEKTGETQNRGITSRDSYTDYDEMKTEILKAEPEEYDNARTMLLSMEDDIHTEIVRDEDDIRTERIEETSYADTVIMTLTDIENPVRRVETAISGEVTVGRGSSCRIKVEGRSISREHAKITKEGTLLYIENISATNQTVLNGNPVTGRTLLVDGSELFLGKSGFRVEIR